MAGEAAEQVVLTLFVRGYSRRSAAAIQLVRRVCDERLAGRFQLEVIDVADQPALVREAGITTAPALVRYQPEPMLRTVGPLTEPRILEGMGLG